MSYKHLFFDLDGTLTDPKEGIIKAFQYALNRFNIKESNIEFMEKLIGPPLFESFKKYYGFNDDNVDQVVAYFREYYSQKGMFQNIVYEGIDEVLTKLCKEGFKLYIATSKPTEYAEQILTHFNLAQCFTDIVGSLMNGSRVKKAEIIQYLIEKHKLTMLNEIVMIGDREHDIIGARESKIDSIGVTYGYGSKEEFILNQADFIINTPDELFRLLTE